MKINHHENNTLRNKDHQKYELFPTNDNQNPASYVINALYNTITYDCITLLNTISILLR